MTIFDIFSELIAPKTKFSRLLVLAMMLLGVTVAAVTLVFNEIKKQDISKSQLKIEQNRVAQIDKQLAGLYEKAYAPVDSAANSKGYDQTYFLKQIEFLKNQRVEAVKNIDDINKSPDVQIVMFTVLASALTIVLLIFFSNSFKSSTTSVKETLETFSKEQRRRISRRNADFLQWVTSNELAQNNISAAEVEKAKMLKSLYDKSEALGEQRGDFLASVIEYTNRKRSEDEILNDKHSHVSAIFDDIQERIKDECNRLNKQAIINLFLCFFIAFVLMTVITYTSIFSTELNNTGSFEVFIVRYLPRIVAVIGLLTMFLYFTRLYKANILDVKYYQNELTNIEVMQVAWQTAIVNNDKDALTKLMTEFSIIDRNKIISKEQTSIEIERIKLENELNKDYLSKVYELLSISRKQNTASQENKNGL